jgi:hypothetical protein
LKKGTIRPLSTAYRGGGGDRLLLLQGGPLGPRLWTCAWGLVKSSPPRGTWLRLDIGIRFGE